MSCKEFEICRNTVTAYLISKKEFTYDELMNRILDNGGVFRISTTVSLNDFLDDFVYAGMIKYSPAENKYFNNKMKRRYNNQSQIKI